MRKLVLVLLLTACSASFKLGSGGAEDTKNIQVLAQGVTTLDGSVKALADAYNKLNARVVKLEPSASPSPVPKAKIISKNSVQ